MADNQEEVYIYKIGDTVRRIKGQHNAMREEDSDEVIRVHHDKSVDLKYHGTGHDPRNLVLVPKKEQVINHYEIY